MGEPWKPNTLAAYRSALDSDRLKKWEDMPVVSITHKNVQDHINALEEGGLYTSARRNLAYLRAFFSWCRKRKQGLIPAGTPLPTDGVELDKPRDNRRERVLSPEEIKVFWQATHDLTYPWGPYYRTLLLTGQRLNEVAQITHKSVRAGHWKQLDNKAGRKHVVPLNDMVLAELKACPRHSEYYFSTRPDVPISGFSKAKKSLDKKIVKILDGKSMDQWTPHDLRRTMTTRLREMRIPLVVCSRLLNHADRGVTAEHYDMYDMLDEKEQAMDAWGDYLDRLINDKQDNVVELAKAR